MRSILKIEVSIIVYLIIFSCGCIEEGSKKETEMQPEEEVKNLPPTLEILNPKVEEWIGWDVNIQWEAYDPENDTLKFDICYGKDNQWYQIASNLTNISKYKWDTSDVNNGKCILKIIAKDGTNIISEEINITVHRDYYGFILESPEREAVYTTECNITWLCVITPRRSNSDDVNIYYSNNNGSDWNFIIGDFPLMSGRYTYLWNTTGLLSSKYYQIKLHSDSKYALGDIESEYFKIIN